MAIPHDRVSDYRKTQLDQYSKQLADARKQIRVLPVNSPERDEQLQVARNLTKQKSQFEDTTDDQLAEELAESDLRAIEQQQQVAQQNDMDRRIEAQRLQRIQNIPNGKAIGQLMKDFAEALAYYRETQSKYNRCIARLNVLLQGWDQVSTSAVADQATKLLERLEDTNLRLGIYNKKLFDECDHAAVQQIFDAWADDAKMVKLREFVGWAN